MVRQFKHHEQKLLKKVDFLNVCFECLSIFPITPNHLPQWKQDANLREIKVMRRYHIQDREDYHKCALRDLNANLVVYIGALDTTSFAARSDRLRIDFLFSRPRTRSDHGWRTSYCPSCTTWAC